MAYYSFILNGNRYDTKNKTYKVGGVYELRCEEKNLEIRRPGESEATSRVYYKFSFKHRLIYDYIHVTNSLSKLPRGVYTSKEEAQEAYIKAQAKLHRMYIKINDKEIVGLEERIEDCKRFIEENKDKLNKLLLAKKRKQ